MFSCFMTQLQVFHIHPSSVLLSPSHLISCLPSVSQQFSPSQALRLSVLVSVFVDASVHHRSSSVDHSALLALVLTASIDLHLITVYHLSVNSRIFLKLSFPSVASLHFIHLIISYYFILSANVSLRLFAHQ